MTEQLSTDDFERLQCLLIELRSQNYKLEETNKCQCQELSSLTSKLNGALAELNKLDSLMRKSKNWKDISFLIEQNESVHRKLIAQEEDFRIQNQSLLNELANVITAKEELENELSQRSSTGMLLKTTEVTDGDVQNNPQDSIAGQANSLQLENESLVAEKRSLSSAKTHLEFELGTTKEELASLKQKLCTVEMHCHTLEMQLKEMEIETISKIKELESLLGESNKLSFHRKELLDDVANCVNEKKAEIESLNQTIAEQRLHEDALKLQLDEANIEVKRLKEVEELFTDLTSQSADIRQREAELLDNAKQLEERLGTAERNHHDQISSMRQHFEQEMDDLKQENATTLKDLQTELELVSIQKSELEDLESKLRQEIKDLIDDKRLAERKSLSVMKDVRRQLASERKRADKVQERLQEFLMNSGQDPTCLGQIIPSRSGSSPDHDACSVSSWSLMSGNGGDGPSPSPANESRKDITKSASENSGFSSHTSSSPSTRNVEETPSEVFELLKRITSLQQDKWSLEERFKCLDEKCNMMSDELLKKTTLIQYWCMEQQQNASRKSSESRTSQTSDILNAPKKFQNSFTPSAHIHIDSSKERTGLRRLSEILKNQVNSIIDDAGGQQQRDVVLQLQCIIEDVLTKNMNLQNQVKLLSEQATRKESKPDLVS